MSKWKFNKVLQAFKILPTNITVHLELRNHKNGTTDYHIFTKFNEEILNKALFIYTTM